MSSVGRDEADAERPGESRRGASDRKSILQSILSPEYKEICVECIKLLPQIAWLVLAVLLFWWFYTPLAKYLERNQISKVGVGMIQFEFAQKQLVQAAKTLSQEIPKELIDRIERANAKLADVAVLWVDDNPARNLLIRRSLRSLGITVDIATGSDEALKSLRAAKYEIVISDLIRNESNSANCYHEEAGPQQPARAGCYLLKEILKLHPSIKNPAPRVIFYSELFDPEWGTPPYAFGATQGVAELFHLILDALERRRVAG